MDPDFGGPDGVAGGIQGVAEEGVEGESFQYFFGAPDHESAGPIDAVATIPNPTKNNVRTTENHAKKNFKKVPKNMHQNTISIKNSILDRF